jgi:hypothetical protein
MFKPFMMMAHHDQLGVLSVRVPVMVPVPHVLQGLVVALVQGIYNFSRDRSAWETNMVCEEEELIVTYNTRQGYWVPTQGGKQQNLIEHKYTLHIDILVYQME